MRARAFGMRVIAYDRFVSSCTDTDEMCDLDGLYRRSDYISLHVPLTPETKGMIDAASIARMKKGVYLVNTCRGQVIVEEDVAQALNEGRLGGYAADVYLKEPPEGSPLLTAPRVILTPHLGASTEENLIRLGDSIVTRVAKHVGK
jgi:D-3-phosphoglycerate dehydrogenase